MELMSVINNFRNGYIEKGENIWHKMKIENKDINVWNSIMNEYLKLNQYNKVLITFDELKKERIVSNNMSYIHALNACVNLKLLEKGMDIHRQIVNNKLIHDTMIQNKLIEMYDTLWNGKDDALSKTAMHYQLFMDLLSRQKIRNNRKFQILDIFYEAQNNDINQEQIYIYAIKECGHQED